MKFQATFLFLGGLYLEEKQRFEKHWQLAKSDQRERFSRLFEKHADIQWTYKELECLLWLCQLDIDTFETFEVILEKVRNN